MAFRAVTYLFKQKPDQLDVLQVWRFGQLLTIKSEERLKKDVSEVWRIEQQLTSRGEYKICGLSFGSMAFRVVTYPLRARRAQSRRFAGMAFRVATH